MSNEEAKKEAQKKLREKAEKEFKEAVGNIRGSVEHSRKYPYVGDPSRGVAEARLKKVRQCFEEVGIHHVGSKRILEITDELKLLTEEIGRDYPALTSEISRTSHEFLVLAAK